MCYGYQLAHNKVLTNAQISCPPFDIYKSKLVIIKWHYVKVDKHIIV